MLETLYATGMRVSELVALDSDDVDLERAHVRCAGQGRAGADSCRCARAPSTAIDALPGARRGRCSCSRRDALFLNHRGNG